MYTKFFVKEHCHDLDKYDNMQTVMRRFKEYHNCDQDKNTVEIFKQPEKTFVTEKIDDNEQVTYTLVTNGKRRTKRSSVV